MSHAEAPMLDRLSALIDAVVKKDPRGERPPVALIEIGAAMAQQLTWQQRHTIAQLMRDLAAELEN